MSDVKPGIGFAEGAVFRPEGARAVRPKAAATVMMIDRSEGRRPKILLGKRNAGHSFMPGHWVFPGGRVDRCDHSAPFATDLRPEVAAVFDKWLKPGHGRAIVLAGIRETWEEVGLLLGRPGPGRPGAGPWRTFVEQGALPDLAALDIVARAITPPALRKRFDTWFLMADAARLTSLARKPDCGELEEIAWMEFEAALALPLSPITRAMTEEAFARLEDPQRPRPFLRLGGQTKHVTHL